MVSVLSFLSSGFLSLLGGVSFLKNLLFVYNHDASWVRNDLDILKKSFNVTPFFFKEDKSCKDIKDMVKESDGVFIWFASRHALKPVYYAKKFCKRIVTVSGGYDVASVKGYGLSSKLSTRWIPKYVLSNSDVVLAFSESAKSEIQSLVRDVDVVVSFGVDTDKFYPDKKVKSNNILTVGSFDRISFWRKGLDRFLEVAHNFRLNGLDNNFYVVGSVSSEVLDKINSFYEGKDISNVVFTGFVSDKDLLGFYQGCKIYLQPSVHEGFGASVAESMLCGCTPVVSNCGSLPEVVGDYGLIVDEPDRFTSSVDCSLDMSVVSGRRHILDNYSLDGREDVLLEVLS